ncbi:radial spoke head 10 homolog B [Periophthalmus magnuspinnatus]|uniref:radial spoke head 10 homolog B n=1 Tax=Periophthalmus magnuspinnatus TaxID=409849 RepID=UPI002436D1BD|nr:radial spoke head 10 homolog B [Periophthalmus magnuspinnatus]
MAAAENIVDLKEAMEQQSAHCTDQKQPDMNAPNRDTLLLNLVIQRYEGETFENQPSGEGVACFVGGHVYKGSFSKGLMEGHGVFTWACGLKYEGSFVSNIMMGLGTYTWPDGSTYNGEVQYSIRHGTGSYYCSRNGVLYKGHWHQGKRHGKGAIYYNQDKTSWYKGDWVMNKIKGYGVRRYPSGNIYEGEWMRNLRHGEGTMKWLLHGQQYEGTWYNGVQHGHGKHTWIIKRKDGSRYSQSNQYVGDFVCGQRQGQGTFYYADGAVYKGEWRNNKKHGMGKFTFKNGKVFQGEFVDDQMIQLRNDKPLPLLASDSSSLLGPDMTLNIDMLLKSIPEKKRDAELKEVELVVLRHSTELRSIYSFYSRLGRAHSPDNTFMLSRMQLWRLLKDCKVHHHDITLSQIDLLTRCALEGVTLTEVHSPFTGMLFCKLLSCLVVIAYHIYHKDMVSQRDLLAASFSKLMTNDILPNAKNVKGFLFRQQEHTEVAMRYCGKSWEVYRAFCTLKDRSREDKTMTCRDLLFMFKEFHLLDDRLTALEFMKVISQESRDPSNTSCLLNLEITFLEFFDAVLGCAEVKCQLDHNEIDQGLTSQTSVDASKDAALIESMMDGLQLRGLPCIFYVLSSVDPNV